MKRIAIILLVAATFAIATANAADTHHPQKAPSITSQSQSGMPMMNMMQMMAGSPMAQCGRTEGWIAFLKTELQITSTQSTIWETFASSLRTLASENAKGTMPQSGMMMGMKGPWPEKVAAMSQMASTHATKLKSLADAARPLYSALSAQQK